MASTHKRGSLPEKIVYKLIPVSINAKETGVSFKERHRLPIVLLNILLNNNTDNSSVTLVNNLLHCILKFYLAFIRHFIDLGINPVLYKLLD